MAARAVQRLAPALNHWIWPFLWILLIPVVTVPITASAQRAFFLEVLGPGPVVEQQCETLQRGIFERMGSNRIYEFRSDCEPPPAQAPVREPLCQIVGVSSGTLGGPGRAGWNFVCAPGPIVLTLLPGLLNLVPILWVRASQQIVRRAALVATAMGGLRLMSPIVVVAGPGVAFLQNYDRSGPEFPALSWVVLVSAGLWFISALSLIPFAASDSLRRVPAAAVMQGQPQVRMVPSRKSAHLALVLSFVWCGFGQIYNGQIAKGVWLLVAYLFSILLIFSAIGLITTPVLWIFGMVDAYRTAEQIDRQTGVR